MIDEQRGCPCGCRGFCCAESEKGNTYTPEHVCSEEVVCENCYVTKCNGCGKECDCDL